jgi:hypothetical protein
MKRLSNGSEECIRCHFVGTAREGAMNEINAYKQQVKSGAVRAPPSMPAEPQKGLVGLSQSSQEQKLKSLKGKSTDDFEIL